MELDVCCKYVMSIPKVLKSEETVASALILEVDRKVFVVTSLDAPLDLFRAAARNDTKERPPG